VWWAPSFRIQEYYRDTPNGAAFARWYDKSAWLPVGRSGAEGVPVAYTPRGWKAGAGWRWDFGALVVQKRGETSLGVTLGGIDIDLTGTGANRPIVSYGYPVKPPFDGSQLFVCKAMSKAGDPFYTRSESVLGIGCDMTGGSSGGPWIWSDSIVSVNSYVPVKRSDLNLMFGPNLNGDHWDTFLAARNYEVP